MPVLSNRKNLQALLYHIKSDKRLHPGYEIYIIKQAYKECARDKLVDRTATCHEQRNTACNNGKVLKLERWDIGILPVPTVTMGIFLMHSFWFFR